MREARRQKRLEAGPVPEICLLDPDGDIVRHLQATSALAATRYGPATTPTSISSIKTGSSSGSSAAPSVLLSPSSWGRNCSRPAAGFFLA